VARPLTADDVEPIARGQMALEDAAPDEGLLVLDTDLISTVVYARHYYGHCPEWIEREAQNRKSDLYLLMNIDVEWVSDPLRDSAIPRESLFEEFETTLATYNANVVRIEGTWEQRRKAAIKRLNSLRDRPPSTVRTPHR
jgi:nicotinamide riboside kinase